nr:MAG TPA: hypothetical protein [Caudoviricetes sp.]
MFYPSYTYNSNSQYPFKLYLGFKNLLNQGFVRF